MKKILIFSLQYYPFVGGAEVALKELTDRMKDTEFHMVTNRYDSRLPAVEQMGNVLVHRIGFALPGVSVEKLRRFPLHLNKYFFQILAARKAEELHRKYRYDATWAMMAHAAGIPAGMFKAQHPEVPYLLTLQEGDPPEHIERLMRPVMTLFRQGFEKADELQAISTFLLSWGKRMGFRKSGVVIPNGVDTAQFSRVSKHTHAGTVLITTSRLVPKNAIDDVIRALALLPEEVTFVIYGTGPEEGRLRTLAKQCTVDSRTKFMGQVPHSALPEALSKADIFIRPSRSEGMGNSFIEAMAAGLPVITTQEGGLSDFIYDAKRNPDKESTAWAVDKNSPEQIAAAVKDILAHREETRATVENAKRLAVQNYEWNLIAQHMHELFDRLFERR